MKGLVIGGAGFIGSHTVDALLEEGHSVRIFDVLQPRIHPKGKPDYLPKEAEFVQGDVTDKSALESALDGIDFVYHFAAYQDYLPDFSSFIDVNSKSAALLFEIIVEKKLAIQKVVIASSQSVLGEGAYNCSKHGLVFPNLRSEIKMKTAVWDPVCPKCQGIIHWELTDESHASPQNAYGVSKYSQEMISLVLGKRYEIPTVAFRYSIVQGPRQSFFNMYSGACRIFCLSLYFDKPPPIYEDGLQIRDYVNIKDVVSANLLALNSSETDYQVFNVGGGKGYTVLELSEMTANVFQKEISGKLTGAYRFGDTRHICSDISKLKALGWAPKYSPEDSLKDYVSWLQNQNDINDVLEYAEKNMKSLNVVRDFKVS